MLARLLLLAALAIIAACATPNTRSSCANSRYCTLSGTLVPAQAESVVMGQMMLANGECVAVSLPERALAELRAQGPHEARVSGRVFEDPGSGNSIAQVLINGRRVGRGLCGGQFFVFVYD